MGQPSRGVALLELRAWSTYCGPSCVWHFHILSSFPSSQTSHRRHYISRWGKPSSKCLSKLLRSTQLVDARTQPEHRPAWPWILRCNRLCTSLLLGLSKVWGTPRRSTGGGDRRSWVQCYSWERSKMTQDGHVHWGQLPKSGEWQNPHISLSSGRNLSCWNRDMVMR